MKKTIATHPLPFHADDLVACALMQAYFHSQGHDVDFIFSRNPEIIAKADAAVDTGGLSDSKNLRFDHHQNNKADRAATGLVTDFLEKQPGFSWLSHLRGEFDKIDAADLGTSSQRLQTSFLLSQFNPTWKELRQKNPIPLEQARLTAALEVVTEALKAAQQAEKSQDSGEVFVAAITQHPLMIRRQHKTIEDKNEGQQLFVQAALRAESNVVHTEQGIEFAELFTKQHLERSPEAVRQALESLDYVTIPAGPQGGLSVIAVPDPDDPMKQKHPFPEAWRGKRGTELIEAVSASTGQQLSLLRERGHEYFCHHSGFFLTMPDTGTSSCALDFCAQVAKGSTQHYSLEDMSI